MNGFFVRCKCKFRRFTGGKSKKLHAAEDGKDVARRAAELCGAGLKNFKITGESRFHFLQSIRITKGADLLLSTSLPIATVASRAGYADMKYFMKLSNVKTDLSHRRKSPVRKKRLHFRQKRGILISFHGR